MQCISFNGFLVRVDLSSCAVLCNHARKDCKMALLQMSSVEEAAEALIVRLPYYSHLY